MTLSAVSTPYYNAQSRRLARLYDGLEFTVVNEYALPYLPTPGSRIMDIGSGSGRDALALARLGYLVTAIEPSGSLLEHAVKRDIDHKVIWISDKLPKLNSLSRCADHYSFILCSAVLMLLHRGEIAPSFSTMSRLMHEGARLALSFRQSTSDDPIGLFHNHSIMDVIASAAANSLHPIHQVVSSDALGRNGRKWQNVVFVKKSALG